MPTFGTGIQVATNVLIVDDFTLILQRIPDHEQLLEKTTCRYSLFSALDHAAQPGSYRVSIEKTENLDEHNQFSGRIPLKPQYPWSAALKNGKWTKMKRGLGENVEAWWFLECIEDIWLEIDGFIEQRYQSKLLEDLELWEIFRYLQPEERAAGLQDSKYHLSAPQRYAPEKWRAVAIHEAFEAYGIDVGSEAIAGPESNTLYLGKDSQDFRGIHKATGQAIEITATEVAGQKLSEALKIADETVRRTLQLCAASPEKHLIVKLRVDKEAFHALLERKPPPARKRRLLGAVGPGSQGLKKIQNRTRGSYARCQGLILR